MAKYFHGNSVSMDIVNELTDNLRNRLGSRIYRIIIFGSYARGEEREESDLDVLIVGNVRLDEVIEITYPLSLKFGVYISPVVMPADHFEMLLKENSNFLKNVLNEGVIVYG